MIVEFTGPVFRWDARTEAWFFTELPAALSAEIREIPRIPRDFGSVRVHAEIGRTSWRTSIFPDGERGVYVLPLKRSVREAESLAEGVEIEVRLRLIDA